MDPYKIRSIGNKILFICVAAASLKAFADPTGSVSSDGERAKVLTTLDEGEIDAAKLEIKYGKNPAVISYAKMMRDQHTAHAKETKTLAKKNSLDLKDSDLSKSLATDAKSAVSDLKKADKANFDKAYIEQQVRTHQSALSVLDDRILPKAENPNLKEQLAKTRGVVSAHLDEAKELQGKF